MTSISWASDSVQLGALKPWIRNPKTISKTRAKRLLAYWDEVGQFQTIAVGPDNEVYDGHQRLKVLLAAKGPSYSVTVLRASRALTEEEREKLVIAAHVGTVGAFDWEQLSEWDSANLREWGFDTGLLAEWRDNLENLTSFLGGDDDDQEEDTYTRRIEAPIYEITGEKPALADLLDDTKTRELARAIEKADVPDEEKRFLLAAAQRHTVLDFGKIAEYYAHSGPEMKALMEDSALVIIDFNKAIENGFVKLTKIISELVAEEYGE